MTVENPAAQPILQADLLQRLLSARHVLVLTGAGMSAESGIPTFRDRLTGTWARHRPEDLATPEAFQRNPENVWNWYSERRDFVREARPHAGHQALVEMESLLSRMSVVTQNVDGLHQSAGSSRVLELHGNIQRSICHLTGRPIDDEWIQESSDIPPRSPHHAQGMARPDVVWFGEALPRKALESSIAVAAECDFCFSIGTTSLVQPAAGLPLIALEHGARLVEINPVQTPLSMHADQCLELPASAALSSILQQLRSH